MRDDRDPDLRQVVESFVVFLPCGVMSWIGVRPDLIEQARGINLLCPGRLP
jgi:hypothetical protein